MIHTNSQISAKKESENERKERKIKSQATSANEAMFLEKMEVHVNVNHMQLSTLHHDQKVGLVWLENNKMKKGKRIVDTER